VTVVASAVFSPTTAVAWLVVSDALTVVVFAVLVVVAALAVEVVVFWFSENP
jgi:flagellar basal body-associated protein FliL